MYFVCEDQAIDMAKGLFVVYNGHLPHGVWVNPDADVQHTTWHRTQNALVIKYDNIIKNVSE